MFCRFESGWAQCVAQLVERRSFKPKVGGSSPPAPNRPSSNGRTPVFHTGNAGSTPAGLRGRLAELVDAVSLKLIYCWFESSNAQRVSSNWQDAGFWHRQWGFESFYPKRFARLDSGGCGVIGNIAALGAAAAGSIPATPRWGGFRRGGGGVLEFGRQASFRH